MGFPGSSLVKNVPSRAGSAGSIPRSERSLGEGNSNPLQYSHLGNPMEIWWAIYSPWGSQKSQTQLSNKPPTKEILDIHIQ